MQATALDIVPSPWFTDQRGNAYRECCYPGCTLRVYSKRWPDRPVFCGNRHATAASRMRRRKV